MKAKKSQRSLGQRRLLAVLYRKTGGLKVVSDKVKVSPQLALFWRQQGFIPLKHVIRASKELGVSPYALNFEGYTAFVGEEVPWKTVVTKCKLTKDETKFILE